MATSHRLGKAVYSMRRGLAPLAMLLVIPTIAPAQSAKVSIEGGADASGHNYTWIVRNHQASPIVYVEIPHYHAGLFFPPTEWTQDCTYLVNVGVPDRRGVCKATAGSPAQGIANGKSAEFRMNNVIRAKRRPGNVLVRFADGTETMAAGIELPHPESVGDKYVPLIGLGIVFVLWLIIRFARGKLRKATGTK